MAGGGSAGPWKAAAVGIGLVLLLALAFRSRKSKAGGQVNRGDLRITVSGARCTIEDGKTTTTGPCGAVEFTTEKPGTVYVDGMFSDREIDAIVSKARAAGWRPVVTLR